MIYIALPSKIYYVPLLVVFSSLPHYPPPTHYLPTTLLVNHSIFTRMPVAICSAVNSDTLHTSWPMVHITLVMIVYPYK